MPTAAADLELSYLPMENPEFSADPLPYFSAAREQHPWLAQCAFGFVVHQHEAIKEMLRLDDKMRPAMDMVAAVLGATDSEWGRMSSGVILAQTGETHKHLRNIVAPLFTPKQANLNRELMQETITLLLDEWLPKGQFDFEEFVSYYPIGVICTMLGASRESIAGIRQSLEALGLAMSMNPELLPELTKATIHIDQFGQQMVADRRAGKRPEKGGELLDALIDLNDRGEMSDRELYDFLIFLFVGGYDTSKNVLTFVMSEMLERPDIYQRCAEDLAFSKKVIEETMRYHSVANIPRLTTADIEYRDVIIPEGSMLFFPVSVSGRDPASFDHADEFDPERSGPNRHMGFGVGMHICLGQFIARVQMEEGLHIIAQRLKEPKLAGPTSWRPFFGAWGLEGLPITFEAA